MAWRWKLGVAAVPAAALCVLFILIPQTPRWLMLKGRTTDAEAAAARLGISVPAVVPPVAPTLGRIDWALLRKPALLVITLASFNQLTGINAVLYYLNDIFASAGYGALSASWQAVVIGLVNLAFTLIGMSLVDRVGRRALLMAGGAGLANCLSVVAVVMFGYAPKSILLWALIGFIASFASSQGACVWVYMSEIFPQPIRAQGAAIGSATHWCMNAIVSAVFPMVAAVSTGAPFVFFALMMLAMMAFLTRLPETRGLALEEVALIY
jgi:MFS family permease